MTITHAGLRSWAKGLYPLEAAVELLVRTSEGRFAYPGHPWIQPYDQPGSWWLDPAAINDDTLVALSGGEQRVLRIVASLAGGEPVHLGAVLPGLDRDVLGLVLASVAHANGSHEHSDIRLDHDRGFAVLHGQLPSLHPWPEPPAEPREGARHDQPADPGTIARFPADPRGTAGRDRATPPRRGISL